MKNSRRAAIVLASFWSLSLTCTVVCGVCPPVPGLPPTSGCDGLFLTNASAIERQSAGIITTAGGGIGRSDCTTVNDGEYIDILDSGCYQLGKDGKDFALTFWLRATGATQVIGTKSQYNSGQGFIVRVSTSSQEPGEAVVKITSSDGSDNDTVESAVFRLNEWAHVAVNYSNDGEGARFEVNVNLASRSGSGSSDVYNSKLRIGDEGWGSIAGFDVCIFQCWGRQLSRGEIRALFFDRASGLNLSSANLSGVMSQLHDHISGASPLTGPEIEGLTAVFVENSIFLDENLGVMTEAFDLVSYYETHEGPLFINARTSGGFEREQEGDDGFELERAIFTIQQAIHDRIFAPENCQSCQSFFYGKVFKTADFFPGAVPISRPPTGVSDVTINATVPEFWGKPVAFATDPARRPTGYYLAPGIVGEVTVPSSMVNKGFSILVGAHTWDKSGKSKIKRFDRVTKTFPIRSEVTSIASPFGGGIYINVPYKSNLGVVTIQIAKGVRSPFFSSTSHRQTTLQEWVDTERGQPGPWADFESDKFMMQVPTSWIYNYADPVTLMEQWDSAMDGVSEMLGFPLIRNRTVLYVQPDISIAHGVYGIGYPQVNQTYNPNSSTDGDSSHFFLTNPIGWSTTFHELGHAQLFSKFPGHTEATVNLPYVYIAMEKFGVDLVTAFTDSVRSDRENMSIDRAAIMWFVTENFRNGNPMNITNSTENEVRYQHRGYGRYVDIADLFGWRVLGDFYRQEHLDYMSGAPGDGLDGVDSRILRLSKAAGVDLTPLIHCWGVHPVDLGALQGAIAVEGLPRSKAIYDRLVHYKAIIPANNAEFVDHYHIIYPGAPEEGGDPNHGYGWYNVWKYIYDESHGTAAKNAMQDIIELYFGADVDPPTPDPMTFEAAPVATGTTSISMRATTASDTSGVEYYFTCTAGGGKDSGWRDSPEYTDSGLSSDVVYSYTVKARDKSVNGFETEESVVGSAVIDLYDGKMGLSDFAHFAGQWMQTNCGFCGGADLTGNGAVDGDDLREFASRWLTGGHTR